jgi:hypothetical protein
MIRWEVAGRYTFASNGIVINPPDAGDFQPNPPTGKYFFVFDKHETIKPDIKYTVRVVRSDGVACAPKDPFISNQ